MRLGLYPVSATAYRATIEVAEAPLDDRFSEAEPPADASVGERHGEDGAVDGHVSL